MKFDKIANELSGICSDDDLRKNIQNKSITRIEIFYSLKKEYDNYTYTGFGEMFFDLFSDLQKEFDKISIIDRKKNIE